jgi:hypothetical protein
MKNWMLSLLAISCVGVAGSLLNADQPVSLKSPSDMVEPSGDCPCGDVCPCRGDAPQPEVAKQPAVVAVVPVIGSRRVFDGVTKELYRVEPIGDGRYRLRYRPVASMAASVRANVAQRSGGLHWTYPGEIRQHLASGHGVNASGMSREEAESLHDSLHNAERGVRVQQPTFYQPETSGCPGGVCPSPVQRRTFFRR